MTFLVRLREKKKVAEGTVEFFFEKPDGFSYIPGQYVDFALINPSRTDADGSVRSFSLVGIPSDPDLRIATRIRETAFKRELEEMPIGGTVNLDGPFGSFTLHKDAARPAVFLAGGIGITPCMSIIRSVTEAGFGRALTLFYSNRRIEDAPFFEDLSRIAVAHERFNFIPTMTAMEHSLNMWNGERGYINEAMLMRHIKDIAAPVYYVVGPPNMVLAMRTALIAAGADEDSIRAEDFSGY